MHAFKHGVMVLLLAACTTEGPSKSPSEASAMTQSPAPQNPPKTTTEQVQRWAPAGASVVDLRARGEAGVDLPAGVDVFMVTSRNRPPADGRSAFSVVAVAGGVGQPILEDKAAILAAVIKVTKDAQKLARVGLLLDGRDDIPLTSASTDEQRKAGVEAPAIVGNAVELWIWSGAPGRNLYHCKLDLSTASLTVALAQLNRK